jgi:hypothetical protein
LLLRVEAAATCASLKSLSFPPSFYVLNDMLSERQDPIVVGNEEAAAASTLPMRHPSPDAAPALWGCLLDFGREESMDELWQPAISSASSPQPCRHCHELFCSVAAGGGRSVLVDHDACCEEALVLPPSTETP